MKYEYMGTLERKRKLWEGIGIPTERIPNDILPRQYIARFMDDSIGTRNELPLYQYYMSNGILVTVYDYPEKQSVIHHWKDMK